MNPVSLAPAPLSTRPRRGLFSSLYLCAVLMLPGLAGAAVCRVSPAGNAAADGSSWGVATSLQHALGSAACTELWLAQGSYRPTTNGDRNISFVIPAGVAVYGGFAGTEAAREQRSSDSSLTELSGDIGSLNTSSDNSYHVVRMEGSSAVPIDALTVLDGLTIREGNADSDMYDSLGGGLLCLAMGSGSQCSPTLRQLRFLYNQASGAGGGMALIGLTQGSASPTLSEVSFSTNAAFSGGALAIQGLLGGSASAQVSRATFNDNEARFGGAVFITGTGNGQAQPTFANSTFSGNRADATTGEGGAMYLDANQGVVGVTLVQATFSANAASGANGGGAIHSVSSNGGQVGVTLRNSILWGDSAGMGAPAGNVELFHASGAGAGFVLSDSLVQGACPQTGASLCSNVLNVNPLLQPLADNGGSTRTHLPDAGSPALDVANPAYCPASDQRGIARPQGSACDLGAVERRGSISVVVGVSGPGQVDAGAAPLPLSGAIAACAENGGSCQASYEGEAASAPQLALNATPAAGYRFETWGGDCAAAGSTPSVTLPLDQARDCSARFVALAAPVVQSVPMLPTLSLMLLAALLLGVAARARHTTGR